MFFFDSLQSSVPRRNVQYRVFSIRLNVPVRVLSIRCDVRYRPIEGKVFYGQEPPSGESTITECGFNYQLLAVILLK